MKTLYLICILGTMSFNSFSQEKKSSMSSKVTTYYFIRHAEKDRSNPQERNPHLNENGLKRAENWKVILDNIKFDAIYATDYYRTIETAKPTAESNNLKVIIYDPNDINNPEAFLKATEGKTVLVVGHSNTTPAFVNAVLGHKKYENMEDDNNGNLYIVTIIDGTASDQVLHIN
ncbi:MAG: phosphoglycerate mutase family protein [Gelidibacter sp.]